MKASWNRTGRRLRIAAFLLTSAIGVFCSVPVQAVDLYLRGSVEVGGGPVRLRDLARVAGEHQPGSVGDKIVVQQVTGARYISATELREALETAPEEVNRVLGQGVWILPMNRTLRAAELEQWLRSEWDRDLARAGRFVLRVKPDTELRVPAAGVNLRLSIPSGTARSGRQIVALDVFPEGQNQISQILLRRQIEVEILEVVEVALPRTDLPRGTLLAAEHLRTERREIEAGAGELARAGEVIGRRLLQDVEAGTVLERNMVQILPVVQSGQRVRLVHQRPGLVFKVRCVAVRAGEVGDQIPVRLVLPTGGSAGSVLQARVIDADTVVLESGDHP